MCISIVLYRIQAIQTAWRQVLSSFVKFTMHSRAPIPVYILGRFCSYMYIHYTPTLQNILYTTYIAALPHMRTVEATAAIAAAVALLLAAACDAGRLPS